MRLIESYLAAVGERLHPSRRAAVEAELRANILDALEARGGSPDSERAFFAPSTTPGRPTTHSRPKGSR